MLLDGEQIEVEPVPIGADVVVQRIEGHKLLMRADGELGCTL